MTILKRRALACLLLACGSALSTGFAQLPGGARLLSIQPTTGVARITTGLQSTGPVRLSKFMEDGVEVPAAILAVSWTQAPGPARADMVLQLAYRMDDQPAIRMQSKALPNARGTQETRFEMPLTPETGRRVTAWRLQLVADGRVIDERTSAAWR